MELRQLRYFIAIVEQGSFSRAATFLNIAQPALSLHVRNMEADLGTPLLYRGPRGVTPTDAGKILLRNAYIVSRQIAAIEDQIRSHEDSPAGVVRLGLPGTISEILAVPLIMAANHRFPKIELRLAEAMSGFVTEWLIDSRIDLALIYQQPEKQNISSIEVLREVLVFFGRTADTALQDLPPCDVPLTFDVVARMPVVVPGQAHGLRGLLNDLASARRVRLNVAIEVDSYSNIKKLVQAGLGCSILPMQAIASDVEAGIVRAWSIESPPVQRGVFLTHSEEHPMTNAVAAIHQLVQEVLMELTESGNWTGAVPACGNAEQKWPCRK